MSAPAGRPDQTVEEALAQPLEARHGGGSRWTRALREAGAVDRAVFEAVSRTPTAELDDPLRRLSQAANRSALWLVIAAALAATGGRRQRRAALEGVAAIAVTSAAVNLGWKSLLVRRRPDRAGLHVAPGRHIPLPRSTSFPSGHSASAFAFASAVSRHLPVLALPLRLLAGAVAYSRVHIGVHYPGDVVIGSIVGSATAATVGAAADRLSARRR